jgi:D-beta-D-heptose 7-phosphate kinase/D-beta-D-heptose 1-phosphate adenosyltransferase
MRRPSVGKVVARDDLAEKLAALRAAGTTIVFTNGCFDVLHRGHVHYLERARVLGDVLVVGVNSDRSVRGLKGPGRPIVPEDDRAHVLAALAAVDFVCLFDEPTPRELVSELLPDVIVKGAGYTEDTIVGADTVRARGGRVVVIEALEGRSTSAILERIAALGGGRRPDDGPS